MRCLMLLLVVTTIQSFSIGSDGEDPISYKHGIVIIQGAAGSDVAEVKLVDHLLTVTVSGRKTARRRFVLRGDEGTEVRFVLFDGHSGDDVFTNHTSIPSIAHGGSGKDRLIGGSGWNHLYGGSGNDYLEVKLPTANPVHQGQNRLSPSSGDDVIKYNDGDLIIESSGTMELHLNASETSNQH